MRIDFVGEGGHRQREHIFAVGLRQATNSKFVAAVQRFADLFLIFTGEFEAQLIVLHFAVPQRIQLGFIFRPRRFAAVEIKGVVAGKVHRTLQHFERILVTLKTTLLRLVIQVVEEIKLAAAQLVTNHRFTLRELFDIACQQNVMAVVQQVQIAVENFSRESLIEVELTIM